MSKPTPKLIADTRGAILILGVVMGTLLVGALWHVASLGDAIIWRERAQDAADAAAFENAVWNARGMNIIVIMNIIMSVLMFLILLYRAIMLFLGALTALAAIACATSWIPAGINQLICASGTYSGQAFRWMVQNDSRFNNAIHRILLGINKAEKVVATATPAIGVLSAANSTSDAYNVNAVLPFSASVIPVVDRIARGPSDGGRDWATRSVRGVFQPRIGWGISLPAQEDRYAVLCERAGELLPSQFEGGLERAGAPSVVVRLASLLGNVAGAITGSVPGLFCMPHGAGGIPQELTNIRDQMINRTCDEEKERTRVFQNDGRVSEIMWPDPNNDQRSDQEKRDGVPCTPPRCQLTNRFDMGRCRERESRRPNPLSDVPNASQPQDAKPAKVWDYASNGNFFMQSWAAVDKEKAMLERDDDGLELADQQRTGNLVEVDDTNWQIWNGWIWAEAEMFYDCNDVWDSSACRTDAMWTIRWRARLRRVQDMRDMMGEAVAQMAVDSVVSGVYRVLGDLTQRIARRGFGIPDILNMNLRDVWYTNEYLRVPLRRAMYGHDWYEAGEAALRGHPADGMGRRTMIH